MTRQEQLIKWFLKRLRKRWEEMHPTDLAQELASIQYNLRMPEVQPPIPVYVPYPKSRSRYHNDPDDDK